MQWEARYKKKKMQWELRLKGKKGTREPEVKDRLAIKSNDCSSKKPGFVFQHPCID